VRNIVAEEITPFADSVFADHIGNLIATVGRDKSGPHVMFSAHTDEVGLMVQSIDEEGFIRFVAVGGVDPRVCPAKRVRTGKHAVPGVIGIKPLHLSSKDEGKKVIGYPDLYIDIGASSAKQASEMVEVGDTVWFDTQLEVCGDILKAKAFDDRAGCYMLAELIKHPFDFPASFVWSVQEEVGLRGARIATARVRPDVIVVLEGTGAGDVPTGKDVARRPFLGKGPVVTILDWSVVATPRLVDLVTGTGDREGIPWQYKRPLVGGTDAGAAIRVKPVEAVVLAIPSRYIHSPVALAHRNDIMNTCELVKAALPRLGDIGL
jgi:endoglucanase